MAAEVGQRAPDFTLPSASGEEVTLSQALREHVVVLAFYHFAFTGG